MKTGTDDLAPQPRPVVPLSLSVEPLAAMLNCELADDPVYDGLELQRCDDARGTGMLAFLSRRDSGLIDYYLEPGLRLDPEGYQLGAGTGAWTETEFEVARLEVGDDGVDAEARFTDVDGRAVDVRVGDRDGRPRRRAALLAPVSAAIEEPTSLLLVWMGGFDLVRTGSTLPEVRIGGRRASTGRLPGRWLHRRELVKVAAPLCVVTINRDGTLPAEAAQPILLDGSGRITALTAEQGGHHAQLVLDPPMPDAAALSALADGETEEGGWHVVCDGARLTGGTWRAARRGERIDLALDVTERWRPGRLPWLMRLVTTVVPVFRRWPVTYRWRGGFPVDNLRAVTGSWERTGGDTGASYRRATGS